MAKVKIKSVLNAYNITRKGLQYYEEKGIISPDKSELNNYRTLDINDIYAIFRSRAYQQYGFTLSEVANIGNKYTLEDMEQLLMEKREGLEREILQKQMSSAMIQKQLSNINLISQLYGKCTICSSDPLYYIKMMSVNQDGLHEDFQKLEEHEELIKDWCSYVPSVYSFKVYKGVNAFHNGDEAKMEIGFCIEKMNADVYGIQEGGEVHFLPARTCVLTVVKGTYERFNSKALFADVFVYMEQENLVLDGDPFSTMIATVHEDGINQQYESMWCPVKAKE